jgi:hypothetical protein
MNMGEEFGCKYPRLDEAWAWKIFMDLSNVMLQKLHLPYLGLKVIFKHFGTFWGVDKCLS